MKLYGICINCHKLRLYDVTPILPMVDSAPLEGERRSFRSSGWPCGACKDMVIVDFLLPKEENENLVNKFEMQDNS